MHKPGLRSRGMLLGGVRGRWPLLPTQTPPDAAEEWSGSWLLFLAPCSRGLRIRCTFPDAHSTNAEIPPALAAWLHRAGRAHGSAGVTAGAGDSAPPHPTDPHVPVRATCLIQETSSSEKGFLGNLNKYTGGSQTESIHRGMRAAKQPVSPEDAGSLGRRRAEFHGEKPGGGRESRRQGLPAGGAGR